MERLENTWIFPVYLSCPHSVFHAPIQSILNLGCQVGVGLCHILQAASVVEPLSTRRCLQVLQSDLVDVVVGMGNPKRWLFRNAENLISCPSTRSAIQVRIEREKWWAAKE